MAEPLKNSYGPEIPTRIATMIARVFPSFEADAFQRAALEGYEALELTPRAWQIAHALRRFLPDDYPRTVEILLASIGPKLDRTDNWGMAPFLYLPHVFLVAEYGLDHLEPSLQAQYELTQRFTAEYSIRAYLLRHRDATLARLRQWARDPSVHVRRLVSEGTRPRLPWAIRLRPFQDDPTPVLELLELLKDDPDRYVQRSVANNLNDIGKDHPEILVKVARRWWRGASQDRQWLINHALRGLVKLGNPEALTILGFGEKFAATVDHAAITPLRVSLGQSVQVRFTLRNSGPTMAAFLVDLRIHFIKANGKSSPKVFKLKKVDIEPSNHLDLTKTLSLRDLTTRKHYSGEHQVEALVNGKVFPLGCFILASTR